MQMPLLIEASVHSPNAFPGDPAPYAGADSFTFVHLRIRDAEGITGHGFTGRFLAREVAGFLNNTVTESWPTLGEDPVGDLMARFNPRAMTGVVISALSALNIALTDLRAKRSGVSVSTLLGGTRTQAPVHVTCGFSALDIDALVEACGREVASGARGVKVLVAAKERGTAEDVARLKAVREAIGMDADLIADANCGMDFETAKEFMCAVADLNLAWLEEPVRANNRYELSKLAGQNIVHLGAGQMEQSADRFALLGEAGVTVIQPNAVFAGGFRSAIDVAQRAASNGHTISPAGGWDILNLHWMCGAMAVGAIELHRAQARIARLLMPSGPTLVDGNLHVPDAPGLGLEPDEDSLEKCRVQ